MKNENYHPEIADTKLINYARGQMVDASFATRSELILKLIEGLESGLTVSTHDCDSCSSNVRDNFDEWQTAEALKAAATRIMKAQLAFRAAQVKAHFGVKTFTELGQL
tara:strand:- start:872 stop:1195 length:324 start_codon:yes stop_codon:yes gene_type:complete